MMRFSLFSLLLLAILTSQVLPCPKAAAASDSTKAGMFDEIMQVWHEEGGFMGTVLVASHGKVIYQRGFGKANLEWSIPNTVDTKFRIGWFSRRFTAIAILQLSEEGSIDLQAPISDYLPECRKDIGAQVTVHHLLTNTAGIEADFLQYEDKSVGDSYTFNELIQIINRAKLVTPPGRQWRFAGPDYILLGAIIENVTEQGYEEVIRERVFEPVGMHNTGFVHEEGVIEKLASGYQSVLDQLEPAPFVDVTAFRSSAAIYSTVGDLYKMTIALQEGKLLSAKNRRMLERPFSDHHGINFIVTRYGKTEDDDYTRIPFDSSDGVLWTGTDSWFPGSTTFFAHFIETGDILIALSNRFRAKEGYDIRKQFNRLMLGLPVEPRMPVADRIYRTLFGSGVEAAVAEYRRYNASGVAPDLPSRGDFEHVGELLMQKERFADAVRIFRLYTIIFPGSWNSFKLLGDAYKASGDKTLAVRHYDKALALSPDDESSIDEIKLARVD